MPSVFRSENRKVGLGPFNKLPFGLLTVLPGLANEAGAENLIFDIRELPPKQYSFPYHYHRNAEEVMMVISGSMAVRTMKEFMVVKNGDILFFEKGETGLHQFYNHTDQSCVYFDVKSIHGLDVVVYPDSGKLMISKYNEVYKMGERVSYFDDEENVEEKWKDFLV
jgi:uncharacterized cupin superfamily protein